MFDLIFAQGNLPDSSAWLYSFMSFVVMAFLSRPILVVIHELGHAVPALVFTGAKVSIYIGSYGTQKKSFHFRIGNLTAWFTINPLRWYKGMCSPTKRMVPLYQNLIFTLAGPLTPLFMATIFRYYVYDNELLAPGQFISQVFVYFTIIDVFINLFPNTKKYILEDGRTTHNDGYKVVELIKKHPFNTKYKEALIYFEQKQYYQAIEIFEKGLKPNKNGPYLLRFAILAYVFTKNYDKAKNLVLEFENTSDLSSDDICNIGWLYSSAAMHDTALEYYLKSLKANPSNKYALNNIGHTFNTLRKYEEAIPYLDKAVSLNPEFVNPYSIRGLAKIKTGHVEQGLEDIMHSIKLNANHADAYRSFGIYYLDKGNYAEALIQFQKAKALEDDMENIDELIAEANIGLSNSKD